MNRMPKMDEMYDPFFKAIADGKEHPLSEIQRSIERQLDLPDEVVHQVRENGSNVLISRVTWAGTYFVKAELAERTGYGIYRLTAQGRSLIADVCSGKLHLCNKYLMTIPAYAAYKRGAAPSAKAPVNAAPSMVTTPETDSEGGTPEDTMSTAYQAITARLEDELLEQVLRKDFRFFEHLVVKLLESMGYGAEFKKLNHTTPASNDGGIDALIYEDRLGFSIIYVQAKRYKQGHNIDLPKIHEFVGAMAQYPGINKGLFITTSDFTTDAKNFANQQNSVKLVLINGKQLTHYMQEYGLGVTTTQTYDIKTLDQDFFAAVP